MFADDKGIIRALLPYLIISHGGLVSYMKHLEEKGIDVKKVIDGNIYYDFVEQLNKEVE